jgi:hypothetical protein
MSKKNLNPESVVNELKGQSVFFRPVPAEPQSPTQKEDSTKEPKKRSPVQVNGRTSERVNTRTDERVNERTEGIQKPITPVRCSYQLFPHQRDAIKKLAFERSLTGEKIDQSGVLREAIEYYFEMRTSERTNE